MSPVFAPSGDVLLTTVACVGFAGWVLWRCVRRAHRAISPPAPSSAVSNANADWFRHKQRQQRAAAATAADSSSKAAAIVAAAAATDAASSSSSSGALADAVQQSGQAVEALQAKSCSAADGSCPVEAAKYRNEDDVWAQARKSNVAVVTAWLRAQLAPLRLPSPHLRSDNSRKPKEAAAAAAASAADSAAAADHKSAPAAADAAATVAIVTSDAAAEAVGIVNRTDANGLGLLHIAAVLDHSELAHVLVDDDGDFARYVQIDAANPNTGLTALHLAASEGSLKTMRVLLEEGGASVRAVSKDQQLRVGPVPVNMTGGKTPLHFAAENGNDECVSLLLTCPDVQSDALDNDGNTALDLALLKRNASTAALLTGDAAKLVPWTNEQISGKNLRDELTRRKRLADAQQRVRATCQANVASNYTPLHPYLYVPPTTPDAEQHVFVPQFLEAVRSADPLRAIRALSTELSGVWSFKMLSDEFCADLLAEIDHYEAAAKLPANNLPLRRPNSMNAYGLIVDDIGLAPVISHWRSRYINLCAQALGLLPAAAGAADAKSAPAADGAAAAAAANPQKPLLQSHHAFLVKYKVGEDLNLATHIDASDVTLNVCLGKTFSNGTLYFHGIKGTRTDTDKGEYVTPHPVRCTRCTLDYAHVKGMTVMHVGRHVHGANSITSGERSNLIVWFRTSAPPPPAMAPPTAAPVPAAADGSAPAAAAAAAL